MDTNKTNHDEKSVATIDAGDRKELVTITEDMESPPEEYFYDETSTTTVASERYPFLIGETKAVNGRAVTRYKLSPIDLAKHIRENSRYFFVRDNAKDSVQRYWYIKGCYRLVSDDELQGYIMEMIEQADKSQVSTAAVREVFGLLIMGVQYLESDKLNADENIINFKNGLLCLDTMKLHPHTPDIITTIQIPCDWKPNLQPTPVFDAFIKTLTDSDKEVESFLLQFMGACISNIKGYRMKKAPFLYGEGDTGKSQYKGLIERLLGALNFSSIDLPDLEERFGTSCLYNKRLAGSSDMTFVTIKELKEFKRATGGDNISAEFKGEKRFDFKYGGFFCFCMNRLPKFGGDNGEWVYRRIVPIYTKNVIPDSKQDPHLLDKMFAEREGIVHKAVMELLKVIKNNCKFIIPTSAEADIKKYQTINNSARRFFEECCVLRTGIATTDLNTTKRVYDVYKEWCKDSNKGYYCTKDDFRAEAARYYNVEVADVITRRGKNTYFIFTLNDETHIDYPIR